MRPARLIALLCLSGSAHAVDRVDLSVGRIEGTDWRIEGLSARWRRADTIELELGSLTQAAVPLGPVHLQLRCPQPGRSAPLDCTGLAVRATIAGAATLDARVDLRGDDATHWRAELRRADLALNFNSADGRTAAEGLRVSVHGRVVSRGGTQTFEGGLQLPAGQAYVEPAFFDFGQHPLRIDGRLVRSAGEPIRVERLQVEQAGIGMFAARGQLDAANPLTHHAIEFELALADAARAGELYLRPLLATTVLRELELGGRIGLGAEVRDGAVRRLRVELDEAMAAAPGPATALRGLSGILHWQASVPAPPSWLSWREGVVGRLPVGGARLDFTTAAREFALTAPARLPVLDGALEVSRFALSGIGDAQLAADVQMQLRPIDLPALCRSLGWPEFAGTLSGSLPGLRLHDRRLDIDGALSAAAFGGRIEVNNLSVIEPFSTLPRIRADVQLRNLDLAALTGAFDFGRITGRLDGDFGGLRLIGWEPVAMNARLYSSAGDDSPRRISQRAIDSISSIGGGPTGLLSRGFFSLFDDFAYARIGWSCVLDNGICRMNGVGPAKPSPDGVSGYVLVQGRGLPRIDVVGYSRQVSWPVFLAQLKSIGRSGPAEVRPQLGSGG